MRIDVISRPFTEHPTLLLALPVFEEEPGSAFAELNALLGGKLTEILGPEGGKKNHLTPVTPWDKTRASRILLVGVGKKTEFTPEGLRQAAGKAASHAVGLRLNEISFLAPGILGAFDESQAIAEGTILASYRYDRFLSEKKPKLETLSILGGNAEGSEKGRILAEATCFARDLGNQPANSLTPEELASIARQTAKELGMTCVLLTPEEIEKRGMGGLLGVSAGSIHAPQMIALEYAGSDPQSAPIALVGKGITFDSGGLCLKPRDGMEEMKDDMCGAAAVLGAMRAISQLKLKQHVVGIIPSCENMPDGAAYRPSDILMVSGKSVEVGNTDAEGRLILADALAYSKQWKPAATIDLATLTGACVIALGAHATGMLGNDRDLLAKLEEAGKNTNERVWELPLWEEYAEQIKSDVADFKNVGGRPAGTITAAAFLQKFVEGPWAHLDIAATSREEKGKPYTPKGISGVGVRLLTNLVENWK